MSAPAVAKTRWRRSSSASSARMARSASCSSRLLIVPMVCGSRSQAAKAAPPLKSTRRKLSRVGSFRAARPATNERRNSLLPEPVVPPTRPWGPSRTRSISRTPDSEEPTGVEVPVLVCQRVRMPSAVVVSTAAVPWPAPGARRGRCCQGPRRSARGVRAGGRATAAMHRDRELRVVEVGDGAGGALRRVRGEAGEHDVLDPRAVLGAVDRRSRVRTDRDDGRAGGGQLLLVRRDDDAAHPLASLPRAQRHTGDRAALAEQAACRGVAALGEDVGVHDDEQVRRGQLVERLLQPTQDGGALVALRRHPPGAGAAARDARVRQPGGPGPVVLAARVAEHPDRQVRGSAVHGRLRQQAAGQGERTVAVTDDADDAGVRQVGDDRRRREPAVRDRGLRLVLELRRRRPLVDLGTPRRVTGAGVQAEEVVVVRPTLPQVGGGDERSTHDGRRVGHEVLPAGRLDGRGRGDLAAEGLDRLGEARLLLLQVLRPAVLLLEPHADRGHGAEQREQCEAGVPEQEHHRPGEHERSRHRDPAELRRRGDVPARRRGHRLGVGEPSRPGRSVERRRGGRREVGQRARCRHGRLRQLRTEQQDRAAHDDARGPGQQDALVVDALPRDDRAVRRPGVAHPDTVVLALHGAVLPGRALGGEHDVRLRSASDDEPTAARHRDDDARPRPPARVTLHPSTARGGSSVVRATRDPSRSTRSRNGVSELVR